MRVLPEISLWACSPRPVGAHRSLLQEQTSRCSKLYSPTSGRESVITCRPLTFGSTPFPKKGMQGAVRLGVAVTQCPSPSLLSFPSVTGKRRTEAQAPSQRVSLTDSECSGDVGDSKSSGWWQQGIEREKNKMKLSTKGGTNGTF